LECVRLDAALLAPGLGCARESARFTVKPGEKQSGVEPHALQSAFGAIIGHIVKDER
jgi:hypothetical protein